MIEISRFLHKIHYAKYSQPGLLHWLAWPICIAEATLWILHNRKMKKDRYLTGAWSGFYFKNTDDALVTPEGREIHPEHLRWLSLTCQLAREWTRLMDEEKAHTKADVEVQHASNITSLRARIRRQCTRAVHTP